MRYTCGLLLAGVLTLGLAAQVCAAPAGFKEHKAAGLTIALPSDWQVAPKSALAQLQKQAKGVKLLMAAQGPADGFPKLTIMEQPQGSLTQAEFAKLDDAAMDKLCDTFLTNAKGQMKGVTDTSCGRVKTEKGTAMAARLTLPAEGQRPAMTTLNWVFYQGKKKTTVVSGIAKKDDAALIGQMEEALKTIKLSGK